MIIFLLLITTMMLCMTVISAANNTQDNIKKADNNIKKTKTNNKEIIYANSKGDKNSTGKDVSNPTTINNALKNIKDNGTIQLVTNTNTDKYESLTINQTNTPANITFTLEGQPGKNIILDGKGINLITDENYKITFKNLEITNYSYIHGPRTAELGKEGFSTSIIIDKCKIHDCGTIFVNDGDLIINNSLFYENTVGSFIWKIPNYGKGNFIVENTIFENNTALILINAIAPANITNTSFINNRNEEGDMGTLIQALGNMTIKNSTIINNDYFHSIIDNVANLTYYKNYNKDNKAVFDFLRGNTKRTLYDTTLQIYANKTDYQPNEALKVVAILNNEIKQVLNNGTVNFTITGENLNETITKNLTNNKAELTYFLPKNITGKVEVVAKFDDIEDTYIHDRIEHTNIFNMRMYNSSTSNKMQFNITSIGNASIDLSFSADHVNVDKSVQLKAVINTGKNVSGKVVFKMDNKSLKDSNGNVLKVRVKNNTAVLNYTIPDGTKAGYHLFQVIYGNNEYKRLSDEELLRIDPINITMDYPKTITTDKMLVNINGKIRDINGHDTVGDHKLYLKLNGVTIRDENKSPLKIIAHNGIFNISVKLPEKVRPGTYNFTLVTGARASYNKLSVDGKLIYKPNIILKPDTSICNNTYTAYKTLVTKTDGTNVNTGSVIFYNGDYKIGQINVTNGQAIIRFKLGQYIPKSIKVKYLDQKGNKIVIKTQKVSYRNPTVKVSLEAPTRASKASNVTVKTYVKDKNDKNVDSGKVEYNLQNKTIASSYVKNGVATATFTIPNDYLGRNYLLDATFISRDYDQMSTKSTMITVTN